MGLPDQETPQRRSPMPMATDSGGTEAAGESPLSCSSSHMATGGGCCGASPPLVVESAVRTRRVGRKCLRRKRGAATGTVVGDRARPGPARTAARAGAPQIHQVLLLDLGLTAARRAVMPVVAAGDDALIVGSSDDCQRGGSSSVSAAEPLQLRLVG